jgi:hypothetical protein
VALIWHANNGRVAVDNVQFQVIGPVPPSTKLLVTLPGQTFTSGSGNSGAPSAQTAGTPFNLILTAVDDGLMVDTTYNGPRTVSYSGPGGGNPTYTTSVTFVNGQAVNVSTTLKKAETTNLTATVAGLTGVASSNLTVNPGALARLQVLLPGETAAPGGTTGRSGTPTAQSAGTATLNGITVNSVDANWNPVSGTPNVVITSSDANATIADDNGGAAGNLTLVGGVGTLSSFTFKAAGARTITASDAAAVLTTDTSTSVAVNAGAFTNVPPLILSLTSLGSANIVVTWSAVSNRTYRLLYVDDLRNSNWINQPPDIAATGQTAAATNAPGLATQRFYRVLLLP